MNRFRKQKVKMFNENPHCRRCGVLMWLSSSSPRATKGLTKEQRDTMATLGHKYSKLDERRYSEEHYNKRHELICHKCNNEESKIEIATIPIEKLWEMSNSYPIGHPKNPYTSR